MAPGNAFTTQFLMLLGEYEYEELERVDPLWALIYFMIFQFLNFFIMLNGERNSGAILAQFCAIILRL